MNKRHARAGLKGLCLTAAALVPTAALAEDVRLTLRNGGSVCGVITSEAGGTVTLMTLAVLFITIGSAASKRQETDRAKFKTMTVWFLLALLLMFIAIPWPFSPLANRPYLRSF